jgi:hypothetical protein
VSGYNELLVDVQLSPTVVGGPFDRCITFELWECPGEAPAAIVEEVMTFTGGLANATVLVPCGGYTCITARDALHTLRTTDNDDFGMSGSQYVADFTGGDQLVGGNLNNDFWIDILDFGVFASQYNLNYGSGNTDCLTGVPHADISGDGIVGSGDFTFIQINFLSSHDANCCGAPLAMGSDEDGPITEISVEDLETLGMGELAIGDLNNDGWLDEADIVEFLNGVRPKPIVTPEPLGEETTAPPTAAPRWRP